MVLNFHQYKDVSDPYPSHGLTWHCEPVAIESHSFACSLLRHVAKGFISLPGSRGRREFDGEVVAGCRRLGVLNLGKE